MLLYSTLHIIFVNYGDNEPVCLYGVNSSVTHKFYWPYITQESKDTQPIKRVLAVLSRCLYVFLYPGHGPSSTGQFHRLLCNR